MIYLLRRFWLVVVVVSLAACDLQPKIASISDGVGDFISSRYPALLADPEAESEIYNSAASDYGIYNSAADYEETGATASDYVNYAGTDDYVLQEQTDDVPTEQPNDTVKEDETKVVSEPTTEPESTTEQVTEEKEDYLIVPDYVKPVGMDDEQDFLVVPEKEKSEPVKQVEKVIEVPKTEQKTKPQEEKKSVTSVVVQKGETLYSIAKKNNTTIQDLATINKLNPPYSIRAGQTLSLVKQEVKEQATKVEINETKKEIKTENKITEKPSEQKPKPVNSTESKVEKKIEKTQTKQVVVPTKKVEVSAEKPRVKDTKTKNITVGRGDTLYSVSRRYAIPVNDLAVMNNLQPPFDLKLGQVLRVPNVPEVNVNLENPIKQVTVNTPAVASVKPVQKTKEKSKTEVKSKETRKTESKKQEVKKQDLKKTEPQKADKKATSVKKATEQKVEKKPAEKTGKKENIAKSTVKTEKNTQKTETKTQKTNDKISSDPNQKLPKIVARSSSKFAWPVRGKILSHYGAKTGGLFNDGINISASAGTSVVAAENGVVAYAGNEVKGMGNLVIIQHADGWMTVYAHLNSMNVRRGVRVKVGQKIGTVGKTGKVSQPQLHFEIRKGRKAYNPINYLKK